MWVAERVLGERRMREIQRFTRNAKLTVVCLMLTILVLRGTVGAGKFGTPQQDLTELRHRFISHPQRALSEHHDARSKASDAQAQAAQASAGKAAARDDEPEPQPRSLRDPPYTLGPKISDWDEQRAAWNRRHPETPPFLNDVKPRVMLVTGSSPKPCENPVGDHYLLKSIKNKIDYCRIHGLEIFYNMALLDAELAGFWAKLPLLRALLLAHPEVEFFWWMDSDAMFTDMAFELPWERYGPYNFILHGWDEMVYDDKNWIGLNTGSFLLRNCQWSLDYLDTWAPMGPKGPVRIEAGKVLTKYLKDRPVFEADDQSAMVYILATQREKWGNKMLENYQPGLGDHRWPLVTHFVGCKPCSKFGDYPVERCLKQMDRAFNFGDNQVLHMYGFEHKSLASRRIKRIRNETSDPLDMKDDYGLLHPAFKALKTST
ncbi:hypothetical protein CFC21_051958 [Triticum aestivum]|uniref:Uncharacterized protein n=2 Tax=Triticum aestivum TaxID=4565 RepID=A0A9R1G7F0_WHEAT|nr:hypothetical protein CFC21_051958 [Triticum aestivum]